MIDKLLIANRGEIACRIIRTARRLGIETVAVYSSFDRRALHVALADESCWIGEPPPEESYLDYERMIAAASSHGANAIHAGYGFLSENAAFAEACASAGIVFVGPPPEAIRAMGLKGEARSRMRDAGVPVLPGIDRLDRDIDEQLARIGYPLLIKPEAGGGGKGMRVVRAAAEVDAAIESARREAKAAFGNDSLMAEKYLEAPRHIEFQVFADIQGNCVHMNERDCSLQRRHQKIIEEAPAPGLTPALREAMGKAATDAARAIGYTGAGTVEFLLAGEDFYFMEMNTRLQVEHPVTEMITGFDLVEWQLRIAAGEPLPAPQSQIGIDGHAMEARLYAEDPLNDFLPVSGTVTHLDLPATNDALRIDNGIREGDAIGVFYDPMMMKTIARGASRDECMDRLRDALARTHVAGVRTNRDFLCHVLDNGRFRQGELATSYLDQHLHEVFGPPSVTEMRAHICAAVIALTRPSEGEQTPWRTAVNFRLNQTHRNTVVLADNARQIPVVLESRGDISLLSFDDATSRCRVLDDGDLLRLECDGETFEITVRHEGDRLALFSHARVYEFSLPLEKTFHSEEEGNVQAPMSGKIVAIHVSTGDAVTKGQPLAIIEAMKMEHAILAPADGVIGEINFVVGDLIDEGLDLLEFQGVAD